MSRIAHLHVPQFAVQALTRADPELAGAPLVVCSSTGTRGEVLDCSARAAALGIAEGLSLAQARALAPDAVYRVLAPEIAAAAASALVDLAAAFSPRVEPGERGEVALDVSDLRRLFADDGEVAAALHLGARKLGLDVRVGLSRDKTTARVAALGGDGVTVVPPGHEPAFLDRLPVALLRPSATTLDTLRHWGVRTIGELATLPRGGLALRLGAEGALLAQVARGQADDPLAPRLEPPVFEEAADLEWPAENAEVLLFVARRLLENLVERLTCRGLKAGDLTLTLKLERAFSDDSARAGATVDARTVAVGAPTREVATLLTLLRVHLESRPPAGAVMGLVLRAAGEQGRAAQLGLFEPAGPSPDKLATLLARLGSLVGADRVGAPVVVDRNLPDAFGIAAFKAGVNEPTKHVKARKKNQNRRKQPLYESARGADGAGESAHDAGAVRRLALHAVRPPRLATIRFDRGRLRYLRSDGIGGQVIACAGPFRVREAWWQAPLDRDYYDVELSDGGLYRVFHDRRADAWLVDGCYD